MLPLVKLYLERAENEIVLAETIYKISSRDNLKKQFNLGSETFYSAVISHCYYSIFYCAKAILLVHGIKTKPPMEHDKTYEGFKKLISSGFISKKLFEIYEEEVVKAESLLNIFSKEKSKRGMFTYRKLPQANVWPARKSLENASFFFKNINAIVKDEK